MASGANNGNGRGWQVAILLASVMVSGGVGKLWGDSSAAAAEARMNARITAHIEDYKDSLKEINRKLDHLIEQRATAPR